MKAIIKREPTKGIEFVDRAIPQYGRDEVLIKVKAAALCSSDVDVFEWTPLVAKANYPLPFILGHEFSGEIIKVGEDVKGLNVGERVVGETHIPCGYCETCRTGNQHICGNHMGVLGRTVDGCFAEYIKLNQKAVISLPENCTYHQGAVLEPLATAMHAVSRANPSGKTLAIMGTGTIGQMAIDIAKFLGAIKIFAIDISDFKLGESKSRGADFAINSLREDVVGIIKKETNHNGVDAIIDFTGNEKVINQCVEALKIAGTLVHVGMVGKPLTFNSFMYDVVYKELILTGIYGRRMYETWTRLSAILSTGRLDLDSYIGKVMPLKDFEKGVEMFQEISGRVVFNI